jgi:hypothetical protein
MAASPRSSAGRGTPAADRVDAIRVELDPAVLERRLIDGQDPAGSHDA